MPKVKERKARIPRSILTKKDGEAHRGEYVATRSIRSQTVVSSGSTASEALRNARACGVEEPVIIFVPKKGARFHL